MEAHINTLAYVNGVFGPICDAKVSIEDRGFQFGDGVYEVIVAHDGRVFQMDKHMRRLRGSAAGIDLDYDFDGNPLEPIIEQGLARTGLLDALIYIQITRGIAPRSHTYGDDLTPTVVMKRALFDVLGGFDSRLQRSQDWEYWLRISRTGTLACITEHQVLVREHPDELFSHLDRQVVGDIEVLRIVQQDPCQAQTLRLPAGERVGHGVALERQVDQLQHIVADLAT